MTVPMALPPEPEPTRLELLARECGISPDELRAHLRFAIAVVQEDEELVWRAKLFAVLGASAVA